MRTLVVRNQLLQTKTWNRCHCLAESKISGKRVTASQKYIYVPNGTLFSNMLVFIEIFAFNMRTLSGQLNTSR